MNTSIIAGTVFNNWTILADAGRGKFKERQVFVRCKCGTDKIVNFYAIRSGKSTQCMNCRFPTLMNTSIIAGTVFNNWTILADAGTGKYGQKQVFVRCKCGADKIVNFYSIRTDVSTQCMNCRFPTLRSGQRFNKWTVHYRVSQRNNHNYYMCECACGTIEIIRGTLLKNGKTGSCHACAKTKHGMKCTSIYKRWATMKQRCMNPNSYGYKYYGGRGIKVCDRWKKFENFLEDMGECPEGLSFGRIDNDGDYEPGNCRWTTRIVQANNKRNNICNRKV